ncbi:hypothetical protein GCM10017567_22240 [Amycolatopsis bullii]|uniref:Uncharacterized protein n=1 Tax=Amycolatopsis bullii TaxID=941987 RepID=A0ABQ3K8H4_9PSEU|nr:hypothetical protein GCM10017567_22240 [Amycolatopsis bullii]
MPGFTASDSPSLPSPLSPGRPVSSRTSEPPRNGQAAVTLSGDTTAAKVGVGVAVVGLLAEVDDGGVGLGADAAVVEPPEHAVTQVSRHAAAKIPP